MRKDLKGYSLASQEIRSLIQQGILITSYDDLSLEGEDVVQDGVVVKKKGWFAHDSLEDLVQAGSFDAPIGDHLFILLEQEAGVFHPQGDEGIYRKLLEMPQRSRIKDTIDSHKGYVLQRGFTYLIPLECRFKATPGLSISSWPKSSIGRVFLDVQMYADRNPGVNFIDSNDHHPGSELMLWLLARPRSFNITIRPGDTLNQLRFFSGVDVYLTPSQIQQEFSRDPLLLRRNHENILEAQEPQFTNNGLRVHANLTGYHTEGIIAFTTRENPEPIDLSQRGVLDPLKYFEPIIAKGNKLVMKNDTGRRGYLLFTKERLKIPSHLSAELRQYSPNTGLQALLHLAGFVDPQFVGDLVFEAMLHEVQERELVDGMILGELDISPLQQIPDKLYGEESGSNYHLQEGPRFAKYFQKNPLKRIARKHSKLSAGVLVHDANVLNQVRTQKDGFEFISPKKTRVLYRLINNGFFHSRYDCEEDELVLQPIPYALLFGQDDTVFQYERSGNIKNYGEERLFKKFSIGVGGHILPEDGPDFLRACIHREVFKEEVDISGPFSEPELVGTLMAYDQPVDRVHFGLIYTIHVDGRVQPKEDAISAGKMVPIRDLARSPEAERYESWSKMLLPHLSEIYERSK